MTRKPATRPVKPATVPAAAKLNGVAEVAPPTAAEKAAGKAPPAALVEKAEAQAVELVRAKASRPTYRRGGLVFNDRDWTGFGPEIGDEAHLAILADPVLTVQARLGDRWLTLAFEDRAAAVVAASEKETGHQ